MPILRAFAECKKPVMGICRGIQLLNVFFGGTLIQDIPDQLGGNHADGVCHPVRALADSVPGRLFGTELMTNSYHHQVIERLGDGLRATAWSKVDNGEIIEAVDMKRCPFLPFSGIRRMVGPCTVSPGCTAMEPLFAELVRVLLNARIIPKRFFIPRPTNGVLSRRGICFARDFQITARQGKWRKLKRRPEKAARPGRRALTHFSGAHILKMARPYQSR
jgi:hypothetical protein